MVRRALEAQAHLRPALRSSSAGHGQPRRAATLRPYTADHTLRPDSPRVAVSQRARASIRLAIGFLETAPPTSPHLPRAPYRNVPTPGFLQSLHVGPYRAALATCTKHGAASLCERPKPFLTGTLPASSLPHTPTRTRFHLPSHHLSSPQALPRLPTRPSNPSAPRSGGPPVRGGGPTLHRTPVLTLRFSRGGFGALLSDEISIDLTRVSS